MIRRRRLVPEVIQASAMDCGPAALKALMEGFGLPVSYGRLREACQTDVDGTSITTLEEVANRLGLTCEEIVIPRDHLFVEEAGALPAVVVIRHANGETHFVVVWSVHGPFVQIMDPAVGRRWIRRHELIEQLYVHALPVPVEEWREWAGSDEFISPLRRQLKDVGVSPEPLIETALADPGWTGLGALDAATRMVTAIVKSQGLAPGDEAAAVIKRFAEASVAQLEGTADTLVIPTEYWSVRPSEPDADGVPQVMLSGAVMVRALGRGAAEIESLSPELTAALRETPPSPLRELLSLLRRDGLGTPLVLASVVGFAAAIPLLEALVFRGLIDMGSVLGLPIERFTAVMALAVMMAIGLGLKLPVAWSVAGLGRALEVRLRSAFYEKIPRLGDRYFRSRLVSDMAERSHSVHELRILPELGEQFLSASTRMVLTTAGIIWLDPAGAAFAVIAALLSVGLPLIFHPLLSEQALRVRAHLGGLSHFYLDALLGLAPIRAHGAGRAVRREHEALVVEWGRSALSLQRSAVLVEGALTAAGFALGVGLILMHIGRGAGGSTLLLIYWVLSLPSLGTELAVVSRQYPSLRSVLLRLLEPLSAPDAEAGAAEDVVAREPEPGAEPLPDHAGAREGLSIRFDDVSVRAAGLEILENVNLEIPGGQHVAVVGPSGAGKSTFVGLMLGWHCPAQGTIHVDGQVLHGEALTALRRACAWVDPSVQVWARPLLENLRYGGAPEIALGPALDAAGLIEVLDQLPDGLQTDLGEGGGLVSGGEGQRVRLGRALLRENNRLVLLDEPFRGLDRSQRSVLLRRARSWWSDSTLVCVTHDVQETSAFDRVLVIEEGRIVEDGSPASLSSDPNSRYRTLLDAEAAVRSSLWSGDNWLRVRLEDGILHKANRGGADAPGPEGTR